MSRVAIVGAGLAGIAAARALTDKGHRPQVFEKARGIGGRCATRRNDTIAFDHGAQYFTARDPRFRDCIDHGLRAGRIARYLPRLASIDDDGSRPMQSDTERFVAVPGMSALVKHLAQNLDVRNATRIVALTRTRVWQLHDEHGAVHGPFDALVLTAPPAQSASLLGPGDALASRLEAMTMLPCWAAMLSFAAPLPVHFDAAFVNRGPLSWIARDSAKPGRVPGERWVAHVGSVASQQWLEDSAEAVLPRIQSALFDALSIAPVAAEFAAVHRWRYALAAAPGAEGCWFDEERRLAVGGDWCAGSRIEGAFLSGQAIAERLL